MATRNDGFILGKHLGKGLTKDETRKKIDIAVDGATIDFTDDGKLKSLASGGLDFAAIDRLPEVSWKKDTVVLAKQDGQYVRLKSAGDIFTDVVLHLNSEKTNTSLIAGQSATIKLVAQVQNAGTHTATNIHLVLTKPLIGQYTLGEPVLTSRGATNFIKVSETEYTVESLSSGGVARVEIPVTYSRHGPYVFGGQVTSTIDTNTSNNSKTVIVSIRETSTETGSNYVPTQDCPLFTITDLDYNKQLVTFGETSPQSLSSAFSTGYIKCNIYGDKHGLANRRFRLTNAEQIICISSSDTNNTNHSYEHQYTYSSSHSYAGNSGSYNNNNIDHNGINISSLGSFSSSSSFSLNHNIVVHRDFYLNFNLEQDLKKGQYVIPTSAYTYYKDTGQLIFHNSFTYNFKSQVSRTNVGALVMYVKPRGDNCKWQCCVIKFSADFTDKHPNKERITHQSSLGDNVTFNYKQGNPSDQYISPDIDIAANWLGKELPEDLIAFSNTSVQLGIKRPININNSVVVNIKKGTNGTFTLTSTDDRLASIQTQGNISTSYTSSTKTLTVTLNNPQIQNSIKFPFVEFRVID